MSPLAIRSVPAVLLALLLGCGQSPIDVSDINPGSVLNAKPATLREDGQPVTGTVVTRNAQQVIVEQIEYLDGFPNGRRQEWYDNGQMKSDRVVRFQNRGQYGGGVVSVGTSRTWCENGTLQTETTREEDGVTGKNESWTCAGKQLTLQTLPSGPMRTWNQVTGTEDTVLVEEGTRADGGGWLGEHKTYFPQTGKPHLQETWRDGKLDGEYKRWAASGDLEEVGTYAGGNKIGTWTLSSPSHVTHTEYDPALFIDPKYATPFMAAIGLQPGRPQTPLRNAPADPEKVRYYVSQGMIDLTKRINLTQQRPNQPFLSNNWTYPYVEASSHILPVLVELGADPRALDSNGRSRLHYCMYSLGADRHCSGEEAARLIGLGLSPNQADSFGNTPLHEVIKTHLYMGGIVTNEKRLAVGELLLKNGGDPDMVNREGKTPIMMAVLSRQFPLATAMLERSKKPALTDARGLNLVQLVFFNELTRQFQLGLSDEIKNFVKLAVSKGVNPAQPIGDMGTLKDIAEQSGAIDLAIFLGSLTRA